MKSGTLDPLRRRTELDDTNAAAATTLLGERIIQALKREFRHHPGDLVHAAESAQDAQALEERRSSLRHLEEVDGFDPETKASLGTELKEKIAELESKLARDRRRQRAAAKRAAQIEDSIRGDLQELPKQLDEAESHARSLGLAGGAVVDPDRRRELGQRIMGSRKLKLLARLVGAFREVAFEARRRRITRFPQELHAVTVGAELEQSAAVRARRGSRHRRKRRSSPAPGFPSAAR